MPISEIVVLAVAGFIAGVVNAVAGGGTFFTFAALVAFGMPTLNANATSAIALVPGSLAAVVAYRRELAENCREALVFSLIGIAGGVAGGFLLIAIGDEGFRPTVPWLLALATLLFASSGQIRSTVSTIAREQSAAARIGAYVLMAVVAIYGGFFGAGMGIMLLAALAIIETGDFHKANAIKGAVATLAQAVAVVLFVVKGLVFWPEAIVVTVAGVAGGYVGVFVARRVPEAIVRGTVVTIGAILTVVFFFK